MGSREKLIVIYSKVGWERLTSLIGSTSFSGQDRKYVLDVINDADCHQKDPSGAHLLYWVECDSSCNDMQLLLSRINGSIPSVEWFVHMIFDHGDEDSYGGYYNNSFSPSIEREFSWTDHHTISGGKVNISDPVTPVPVVTVAINNHKCGACGNDRCSSNEKSCWKCGNPL